MFVFRAPLSSPFNRCASVNTAVLISLRTMEEHSRDTGVTKKHCSINYSALISSTGLVRCANGQGRRALFEQAAFWRSTPKSHRICCENKRNPFLWFWMFLVSSSGFKKVKSFPVLGCVGCPETASCFKLYRSLKFGIQVMLKQAIFIYWEIRTKQKQEEYRSSLGEVVGA